MIVLVLIETVLLAVLTVLVAGLLRGYGTVLRRLAELDHQPGRFELAPLASAESTEFGTAHDIAGETPAGELVSTRVVGVGHDTLLLFLSSGCATCATFWTELNTTGALHLPPRTRLLIVAQDAAEESPRELAALVPEGLDVVLSSAAWRDYGVPGSPHVVYVEGASGKIRGEGTGQSLRQVAELLAQATGDVTFVAGAPAAKSPRDRRQEADADRELLAAGILPGDPRLYGQ